MRFSPPLLPPPLAFSSNSSVSRSIPEKQESNGIDRPEGGGKGGGVAPQGPTGLVSPVIVSVRLRFMRNLLPTSRRASLGHSRNQSMVVQLIRAGYWRNLFLNASPIGLMHTTTCILARDRSINSAQIVSVVGMRPSRVASFVSLFLICENTGFWNLYAPFVSSSMFDQRGGRYFMATTLHLTFLVPFPLYFSFVQNYYET